VWVLSNAANAQCFTFKLGKTNKFTVTNKVIKVSDMTNDKCNPNDVSE
jgi:hypothetical protein